MAPTKEITMMTIPCTTTCPEALSRAIVAAAECG